MPYEAEFATDCQEVPVVLDGDSATLTITATVNAGTAGSTITNTANATAVDQPDSHAGDNSDSADIFPNAITPPEEADLHLIKDVSDHLPMERDTITYTVTVASTGPDDSGTDIWSVGNLADGGSETLTVTVTVNGGTAGSSVFNTATATVASPIDPHSADSSDTAEFFVPQAPSPVSTTTASVFPNLYIGMAAALLIAILAHRLRPMLAAKPTE